MPEFLRLLPPGEALAMLLNSLPELPPAVEMVDTLEALGRVTAEEVHAGHPLPAFVRSTVDGYAIRAKDSFGVSEGMPGYLALVGEIPMGSAPAFELAAGQAALIHTGGMLPKGADAVAMLEQTQEARSGEIELLRALAVGENVLLVGEDVAEGQVVLPCGVRLRPAEIGGCMGLGIRQLRVAIKPYIGILSTGDEVIPPEQKPLPGQVRDINSYSLAALVTQSGGVPRRYGILPDRQELLKEKVEQALAECDLVSITAGSSASRRDLTAAVVNSLGPPGVLVHGVNIRPGKPTILGVCQGKAVIGLPGNPVSALVIARLFIVPLIEKKLGIKKARLVASLSARLTVNIASQAGREDWVAVKLVRGPDGWQAEPIFTKSNLIFSLASADGLVRIPPDATGVSAGEKVEVDLL